MPVSVRRESLPSAVPAFLAALAAFALSAPVHAASWIDCTGQMVTTTAGKPDQQTSPAHDIYALNDDTKTLHKYSESRKTTDTEPVTLYTMDEVKWAEKPNLGVLDASWEGRIDRKTMALKMDYHQGPETTVWTEQCRATDAPPMDTAAAAPEAPKPVSKDAGKKDAGKKDAGK